MLVFIALIVSARPSIKAIAIAIWRTMRQDARTFYANWSSGKIWRDNRTASLIYYATLVPTDHLSFLCQIAGEGARSSSWHSHRWWVKSSTSWRLSLCKSRSLLDLCWLYAMQPDSNLTHGFLLLPSMPYTASCLSFLWVSELANDRLHVHHLPWKSE